MDGIDMILNRLDLGSGEVADVSPLGDITSDDSVCILVGASFVGRIGVCIVDVSIGSFAHGSFI